MINNLAVNHHIVLVFLYKKTFLYPGVCKSTHFHVGWNIQVGLILNIQFLLDFNIA